MENFKMEEIKLQVENSDTTDFEVLEEAITPSWGIVCSGGSFGIWC